MSAPAQGTPAAKAAPGTAAPSFAGVSYEEALRRARDLVPALRERKITAEDLYQLKAWIGEPHFALTRQVLLLTLCTLVHCP